MENGRRLLNLTTRIGTAMGRWAKKRTFVSGDVEGANWLMGIASMALVVGGMAGNPGPPAKYDKMDQIFKEVKNQEKEDDSEII